MMMMMMMTEHSATTFIISFSRGRGIWPQHQPGIYRQLANQGSLPANRPDKLNKNRQVPWTSPRIIGDDNSSISIDTEWESFSLWLETASGAQIDEVFKRFTEH